MLQKLKVLIAYDKGWGGGVSGGPALSPTLCQGFLEEELKAISKGVEFTSYEMKREDTPSWITDLNKTMPQGNANGPCLGNPKDLIDRISDVDVLVVQMAPVLREVIEAAPKLKVIGVIRSGPDNVDWDAATKRGIPILYTPGRNSTSVAEIAMSLILCEMRNIARVDAYLKSIGGRIVTEAQRKHMLEIGAGPELEGKTIGIVGLGKIGGKMVPRAKGMGMRVIAFDPYIGDDVFEKLGAKRVDLDTLMREADVVSVHILLNPGEKHIIGKKEIGLMKKTAYLINTAGGPVVDNESLNEALKGHLIAGAGVGDAGVIDPNTVHITLGAAIGSSSPDIEKRGYQMIAQDIARLLRGEKPLNRLTKPLFHFK